jgi:glycosyltransferase involved in cell wall biosynthesis
VRVLIRPGADAETAAHLRELGLEPVSAVPVGGDLIVVRAGARASAGFAERLAAAAGEDGTVATVSALGGAPGAAGEALGLRPRLLRPALGCAWVSRAALDLAGPLDDGFAARCSELGFLHLLAEDVVVSGIGETVEEDPNEPGVYGELLRPSNRLTRALTYHRRLSAGLEVTLDGRSLGAGRSGTEVTTLALAQALERVDGVHVRLLLESGSLGDFETITDVAGVRRTALVHRPYQVSSADDLSRLAHVGQRLVVSHLDLLLFHDPAYHRTLDAWAGYRRLTAAGLAAADLVVAISDHVRDDLLAEDLLDPERVRRVYLGTDHDGGGEAVAPAGLERLGDRPFLVQLGSDLRHKNRPFSLALLRELRALGWPGGLVLAGPGVQYGSSREAEDALLADPELAAAVVRLGSVSDAERRWLYRSAAAVVFPSVSEGFGLVPFEAARAGTPSLFAPVSALRELLGVELARLVPWDARASAAQVLPVLSDPDGLVAGIAARGEQLTWDRTAGELVELYEQVLRWPARPSATAAYEALAAEARRGHWEGTYWALRDQIGPTGLALVGEDALLPEDAQRTLAALAGRRATRRGLLAVLRQLGRLGSR